MREAAQSTHATSVHLHRPAVYAFVDQDTLEQVSVFSKLGRALHGKGGVKAKALLLEQYLGNALFERCHFKKRFSGAQAMQHPLWVAGDEPGPPLLKAGCMVLNTWRRDFLCSNGYLYFNLGKDNNGFPVKLACHRFVCWLHNGMPPPEQPFPLHHCNNRKCINPLHLKWGDPTMNSSHRKTANSLKRRHLH